ncbi:MAG: prephenate dehydrogenase/arogenate dehydrogenase family protein [Candidatus Bathyarchaeia archaeon]
MTEARAKLTVNIVGGAGKMGRLLATVLKGKVETLRVVSRSPERAREAAGELNVEWSPIENAHDADVVIVSVPINETVKVCKTLARDMSCGSLLIDISSVKTGIVEAVSASTPSTVEYLSIHPLFGPNLQDIVGKRIVAIKVRPGPKTEMFLNLLRKCGSYVKESSVGEHDEAMASIQVLHHYALVSLSKAIGRLVAGRDLSDYVTESLERTLMNLESIQRNWDTICEIQKMNPHAEGARRIFLEEAATLVSFDRDLEKLGGYLQDSIRILKPRSKF